MTENPFLAQMLRDLESKTIKSADYVARISQLVDEQTALENHRAQNGHRYHSAIETAGFSIDATPHLVSVYLDAYKVYIERSQRISDMTATLKATQVRLDAVIARAESLRELSYNTECETRVPFQTLGDVHTWANALHKIALVQKKREDEMHTSENQLREIEKSLCQSFSNLQNAHDTYNSLDMDDLVSQREKLIESKEVLQAQYTDIDHTIVRLNVERDQASKSTAIADATQHSQLLRDELQALHEHYRALYVAHQTVSNALETFRENNQPELLRVASSMLSDVTNGEWEAITVEHNDSEKKTEPIIRVRGPRAQHGLSIAQLSRGTREQLYLCLRLALMETSPRGKEIPVLLDDIAVNSDKERAIRLAEQIKKMGEVRQVIYFTCHEMTRDILSMRAGARVISI